MTAEVAPREWWERPPFIRETLELYCDHPRHRERHRVAVFGLADVPEDRLGEFRLAEDRAHDPAVCTGGCVAGGGPCYRRTFWAVRSPVSGEMRKAYRALEAAGEMRPDLLDALYGAQYRLSQRDVKITRHAGNVQAGGEAALSSVWFLAIAADLGKPVNKRDPYCHPLWGDGYAGRHTRYWYQYAPRNGQIAALQAPGPEVRYLPQDRREDRPMMYREGLGLLCEVCQRQERSVKGRNTYRVDVTEARLYDLLDTARAAGCTELSLRGLRQLNSRG